MWTVLVLHWYATGTALVCAGVVLVLCLCSTAGEQVLHGCFAGATWAQHWYCNGTLVALHWYWAGTESELHGHCAGSSLLLRWHYSCTTPVPLVVYSVLVARCVYTACCTGTCVGSMEHMLLVRCGYSASAVPAQSERNTNAVPIQRRLSANKVPGCVQIRAKLPTNPGPDFAQLPGHPPYRSPAEPPELTPRRFPTMSAKTNQVICVAFFPNTSVSGSSSRGPALGIIAVKTW